MLVTGMQVVVACAETVVGDERASDIDLTIEARGINIPSAAHPAETSKDFARNIGYLRMWS